MLYKLLYSLYAEHGFFSGWNVFQYVTVRAALAAVTAFLFCVVAGPRLIRFLRRFNVSEQTGKSHSRELAEMHKGKRNTPTMGGLLIVMAVVVATLLWADPGSFYVQMVLFTTLALAALGFWDDYVKLTHPEKHGVSQRGKLSVQIGTALVVGLLIRLFLNADPEQTGLTLPFVKTVLPLGLGYILMVVLVMVGTSNAVNLADGLDGLAVGCSFMVALALGILAYVVGRADFSSYLLIQHVVGGSEMAIFCSGLAGACLGFLWFNCHPAEVFMGDTGALPIGGAMGVVSVIIKQEAVLAIAGGIFVIEALSVLIQVTSFRLTGKRVFKIAPLHHHFQFIGWDETKVTIRFWIVGAILALAAMATLKLR